ncbi:MAG: alcohol dehydrogenase [Thermoleophilia bacterium]|nr:alcohol dehydrogenase [Thermoleophilia bacterium]
MAAPAAARRVAHGFHVSQPTRVAAGRGIAARIGGWTASYGSRALVIAGTGHARASGLLGQVDGALRADGVATELLEGIAANPTASIVDAGAALARAWRADVVVAVGGGSVIDVAKAIATAAATDPRPYREHLSGLRPAGLHVVGALPVVALPTLPGSGSETNGTSVITDDETGRKLSAHTELAAPRVALLDPDLAADADPALVGAGLVDAICHALEAALSSSGSIASDGYAEQALRTLLRLGADPLAGGDAGGDALLEAWWATNVAGQSLTLAGSLPTHPLAHPLSARLDARHGEAVAALEAAVLVTFADRFAAEGSLARVAGWLDVRGAADPDAALRGIIGRLVRACTALGVRASVGDLGLSEAATAVVVRDARASGSRGLANLPGDEPTPEELFRVLDLARECGPTTPAKRLLARADELFAAPTAT